MKKEIGVQCGEATAKAFFRTISVGEHETVSFLGMDKKGAICEHATRLSGRVPGRTKAGRARRAGVAGGDRSRGYSAIKDIHIEICLTCDVESNLPTGLESLSLAGDVPDFREERHRHDRRISWAGPSRSRSLSPLSRAAAAARPASTGTLQQPPSTAG